MYKREICARGGKEVGGAWSDFSILAVLTFFYKKGFRDEKTMYLTGKSLILHRAEPTNAFYYYIPHVLSKPGYPIQSVSSFIFHTVLILMNKLIIFMLLRGDFTHCLSGGLVSYKDYKPYPCTILFAHFVYQFIRRNRRVLTILQIKPTKGLRR